MRLSIDDLPGRIHAALCGALAGEERAGTPAGAAQLLEAAESAAACDGYDPADLRRRGLDSPGPAPSAILLRALPYALLSPLDRPLLRRSAHRVAVLAGGGEGAAITAVAAAVLAADLLRFELQVSLARLHQTLLEEAPAALLRQLRPLGPAEVMAGDADPAACLRVAITALDRALPLEEVLDEVAAYADQPTVALSLAGALAGARQGSGALEPLLASGVPAAERAAAAAEALAARALARLPDPPRPPLDGAAARSDPPRIAP